jgi:3-hydroxyisobutyrate dehydrogenase-like beta-hydroxyacid dehydrogenase
MTASLATVGIISIGEMGLGIAKLLVASGYRVTTNITGRRYVICEHELAEVVSDIDAIAKIHILEPSRRQ